MSDFFGKKPNPSGKQPPEANPWQQDPFTTYNDNESIEWPPAKPVLGNRPAFARVETQTGDPDVGKPDFTAVPARTEPPMPVYNGQSVMSQTEEDGFATAGADAPTRVGAAFTPPLAGARASASSAIPAPSTSAGRHRRVGRVPPPEAAADANVRVTPVAMPLPHAEQPAPSFDPFEAGDSEAVPSPREENAIAAGAAGRPVRNAVPGQRYTGARTALPRYGGTPELRRPSVAAGDDRTQNFGSDGAPPPRERPAAFPRDGEPWPFPQNESETDVLARQVQPGNGQEQCGSTRPAQRRELQASARRMDEPAQGALRDPPRRPAEQAARTAPARSRNDFEDEYEPEEEEARRGGVLVPVLVVLLVIGGLLAGILLPNWDNMGGGLGTAMAEIKTTVIAALDSVKELVSPTEASIESFSISPTSATAPVELVFTVQTSSSVKDLRILNQEGTEILRKTLTDSDTLGGEVTKNSNGNIWTLRYTYLEAYSGLFAVQAMQKDGTWSEDFTLEQTVSIAAPVATAPPVQNFETDLGEGAVPATVGFTMVTSLDVTAVQIVNDYGDVVAEAYLGDAGNQVLESGQTRTWSLNANVEDPYSGSFFAAYETKDDLTFIQSDYGVDVTLYNVGTMPEADVVNENGDTQNDVPVVAATQEPTAVPTASPTATPTATPSPEPTPATTPEPTALPILSGTADDTALPSVLKLTAKAYEGTKKQEIYSRDEKIVINDPFTYAVWDQSGVLTFRGGPFRQNAASGTVEITSETLTELWKVAMEGSISAKSATLTGVSWPGQALIVKWPTQLRSILGIKDAFKEKTALKEVIVGSQNGYLYFIDLVTGELTRDPVDLGYPSNGVLSLQTNASPLLAIGQHLSVLSKKTIDNGLHLFNLLTNKELALLDGRDKLMQSSYSGFNGAPLFDMNTGTMILGGENGLLYTMKPNDDFDYILGTLKISPDYQRYSWLANKQKVKSTNVDGAVAMYGSYVYFADQTGILQCVDINTLTPLWAADTGDNTDATIALDMENDTGVALYTGNTIVNQGRSGVCTIRRYDALSGKEAWAFQVPDLTYSATAGVGCYASPVVGQNTVSDLVFFTVTNGTSGATVYALTKATGDVRWSKALETPAVSSPVAVYNLAGDAWLVQAESDGKLHLMDAVTGKILNTLQLDGIVEASPAVYRDVLVITTTGVDTSTIYGIKLE
ncbi:MAG: PQQ-binding-like beta-propeller repeat protein [Eubacteriales bacterium]|nr:PQQ-binding-like beta-propeller repeat protein [Eubacteriales bacterium]